MEFFNGHQCGPHGTADVEDDTLVYRNRSNDALIIGRQCVLKLRVTQNQLMFENTDGNRKKR